MGERKIWYFQKVTLLKNTERSILGLYKSIISFLDNLNLFSNKYLINICWWLQGCKAPVVAIINLTSVIILLFYKPLFSKCIRLPTTQINQALLLFTITPIERTLIKHLNQIISQISNPKIKHQLKSTKVTKQRGLMSLLTIRIDRFLLLSIDNLAQLKNLFRKTRTLWLQQKATQDIIRVVFIWLILLNMSIKNLKNKD